MFCFHVKNLFTVNNLSYSLTVPINLVYICVFSVDCVCKTCGHHVPVPYPFPKKRHMRVAMESERWGPCAGFATLFLPLFIPVQENSRSGIRGTVRSSALVHLCRMVIRISMGLGSEWRRGDEPGHRSSANRLHWAVIPHAVWYMKPMRCACYNLMKCLVRPCLDSNYFL